MLKPKRKRSCSTAAGGDHRYRLRTHTYIYIFFFCGISRARRALSLPSDNHNAIPLTLAASDTAGARRLAYRVARAYAARVEGGATVEQADAGSEPIGFLDCFLGACLIKALLFARRVQSVVFF